MISKVYGQATLALFNKEIDYLTDTVKVALLKSTYTPDQDNHNYLDDVTASEATDGSYARQTLGTKTAVYDSGTNTLTLDCADITFTSLTETNLRYAVFFVDTTVASTSPLLCYWDFEANQSPVSADFTLNISASGLITLTVS